MKHLVQGRSRVMVVPVTAAAEPTAKRMLTVHLSANWVIRTYPSLVQFRDELVTLCILENVIFYIRFFCCSPLFQLCKLYNF